MIRPLLASALVLGCGAPHRPPPPPAPPPSPWAHLDAVARSELENHALVGLAVGVAYRGEVVFAKGYGFEDREARVPVDPDATMFRWASVSKTMTSLLVEKLASEGVVDWSASTQTYYPAYTPTSFIARCTGNSIEHERGPFSCTEQLAEIPLTDAEKAPTLLAVARHLAGIAHYANGRGTPDAPADFLADAARNTGMEAALAFLVDKPLAVAPGTYAYSTFGYNLLGVVAERASRQSFAQLIDSRVNAKLGTRIAVDREAAPLPRRAVGYLMKAGVIERQTSTDVSWKAAGGGLISTLRDFARYCAALDGEAVLSAAGKARLWQSQRDARGMETNYGAGFAINQWAATRWVGHQGAQEKARTSLDYAPDEHLCVVVMTNAEYANIFELAAALDRAALEAVATSSSAHGEHEPLHAIRGSGAESRTAPR